MIIFFGEKLKSERIISVSSTLKEITEYNSGLQKLKQELDKAVTLKSLVLTGFRIGMAIAVLTIEATLADRAYNTVVRPVCPKCKASLESKGWLPRAVMTVIGYITWKRKVWRCPDGCRIGQTAPFDSELGLRPNQRTGDDVKQIACVLAVFLPFNMAASSFAPLCEPIFQGFQEMVDLKNSLFGQCEIRHLHPIMTKN